ncbi:calcium-binding protein [Phaeobacter italicus]|uniref:calcium-binding protein n=1 Tax=Phaeobacter italicus TaxID=481446 RepID=UPI002FDB795F
MNSITFADGVVLVGGTASSGVAELTATAGNTLDVTTAVDYNWTGESLSGSALGSDFAIVSVDGIVVADAGTTFDGTDGSFIVSGSDTVTFTPSPAAVAAQGTVGDKATFSYDVVLADEDGNQKTVTVNLEVDIEFSAADDTFNASVANKDADETSEAGGDDTFNGDDQNNEFIANTGNDTLMGANGNDTLDGGNDTDFLRGGNGADVLDGGAGNDDLGGGASSDAIFGDDGNDVIFGGQGDDSGVSGTVDDSLGSITIQGLNGGTGNDVINGGAGNDLLAGGRASGIGFGVDTLASGGDDTLRGGAGEDTLLGGVGDDELRGGADKDVVNGGDGADLIYTSLGGDELSGGGTDGDEDVFVLKNGTGTTTITDFQVGEDKLNVSELANGNVLEILDNAYETAVGGTNTVYLALDDDTTLLLTGVSLSGSGALNAADFSNDALA